MERPEAEHALAPVALIAQYPRPRAALGDLQDEAIPVVIAARLLQPLDAFRRQPVRLFAHVRPLSVVSLSHELTPDMAAGR